MIIYVLLLAITQLTLRISLIQYYAMPVNTIARPLRLSRHYTHYWFNITLPDTPITRWKMLHYAPPPLRALLTLAMATRVTDTMAVYIGRVDAAIHWRYGCHYYYVTLHYGWRWLQIR